MNSAFLYALPNFVSAAILFFLAAYAWIRRKVPAAPYFILLMLLAAGWAFTFGMTTVLPDLSSKLAWGDARFLFVPWLPVAILAFVLSLTGRTRWLRWPVFVALGLIPATTTILSLTTELHGLFRFSQHIDPSGISPFLISASGPWYNVHFFYTEALILFSLVVLVASLARAPRLLRWQIWLMLVAIILPVANDLLNTFFMVAPLPGYNLGPTVLVISGILEALAIFRFSLLDLVPIAREQLVESMQDPVLAVEEKGRIVDLNPSAEKVFGVSRMTAVGRLSSQVLTPDCGIASIGESGEPTEVRFPSAGQTRTWSLSRWPVQDRHKRLLGQVFVWRDISERKRVEDALAQSERRFREMADHLPQPTYETDQEGRFTYINLAGLQRTGYSTVDMEEGFSFLQLIHPDEQEKAHRSFQELLTPEHVMQPHEYRLVGKTGFSFPAMLYSAPILEKGKVIGVRGFMIDISERKRAEQLQADMVRSVVHDLSNPIASIQAVLDLLAAPVSQAKQAEYLAIAQRNADRLQQLSRNLLEAAQIEAGELQLRCEPLDPAQLLRELAEMIQPLMEEKQLSLRLLLPDQPLFLEADRTRLEEVFSNLWVNSLKFTPAGGSIETELRREGDWAVFSVQDSGSGISSLDLPRVFQRFVRGSSQRQGSGLGLFIARWIVQAHGGRIEATSLAGQGACFTVRLPLALERSLG